MTDPGKPRGEAARKVKGGGASEELARLRVDLLRAELYRLLDELARAPAARRPQLVGAIERAWARYQAATRP